VVEICRKCGMSVFGLDEEARCEIWLEAREERLSTGCSIVHMGRNCEEDTNESSTAAVGESEPVDPKDVDIDAQPNDSGDMESLLVALETHDVESIDDMDVEPLDAQVVELLEV
jgi:hypothetical protein